MDTETINGPTRVYPYWHVLCLYYEAGGKQKNAMTTNFTCGAPGCLKPVAGVYCPDHRATAQAARDAIRAERSERMKRLREDPAFLAKLAASRKPAVE